MSTIVQQGLAFVRYSADGASSAFTLPFDYLYQEDIKVTVNGEEVPFTWLNDSEVQLTEIPSVNDIVFIRRETSQDERLVNFQDGGQLREKTLDLDSDQLFNLTQEALDWRALTPTFDPSVGGVNAQGDRIVNLGPGINGTDAVNMNQLNAMADHVDQAADVALQAAEVAQTYAQISSEQAYEAQQERILAQAQVTLASDEKLAAQAAAQDAANSAADAQQWAESVDPDSIAVAQRYELLADMEKGDLGILTDVGGVTKVAPIRPDGSLHELSSLTHGEYSKRLKLSDGRFAVLRLLSSSIYIYIYRINEDKTVTIGTPIMLPDSGFVAGFGGKNIDAFYDESREQIGVVYSNSTHIKYGIFSTDDDLTASLVTSEGYNGVTIPNTVQQLRVCFDPSSNQALLVYKLTSDNALKIRRINLSAFGDMFIGSLESFFLSNPASPLGWDLAPYNGGITLSYVVVGAVKIASFKIEGGSVTWRDEVTHSLPYDPWYLRSFHDSFTNKVLVVHDRDSVDMRRVVQVVSVDNDDLVTVESNVVLTEELPMVDMENIFIASVGSGKLLMLGQNGGPSEPNKMQIIDVSTSTATITPMVYGDIEFHDYGGIQIDVTTLPNLSMFGVNVSTGRPESIQLVLDSTGAWQFGNVNADGVMIEHGDLGETRRFALKGEAASVFTGLTLGADYYIQADGSLSTVKSNLLFGKSVGEKTLMLYPNEVARTPEEQLIIQAANRANIVNISPCLISGANVPLIMGRMVHKVVEDFGGAIPWVCLSTGGSDASRRMMISEDGFKWRFVTLPNGNSLSDAHYNANSSYWIAIGGAGTTRLVRSNDGVTWTAPTTNLSTTKNWKSITGFGPFMYAVNFDTSGIGCIAESYDGTNWTPNDLDFGGFVKIVYGYDAVSDQPVFIAVRQVAGHTHPAVRKVGYGGAWEEIAIADRTSGFTDIIFNKGKFIASNSNGHIYVSSDWGDTWERTTSYVGNMGVLAGGVNSPYIMGSVGATVYASRDGLSWFPVRMPEGYNSKQFLSMAYGDGRFIIGDRGSTKPDSCLWITGCLTIE